MIIQRNLELQRNKIFSKHKAFIEYVQVKDKEQELSKSINYITNLFKYKFIINTLKFLNFNYVKKGLKSRSFS